MSPPFLAATITLTVLVAGWVGLALQRILPESFTSGSSRDTIGAVAGMLTLLSALVMGLLIWTAYGVYAGQNLSMQALAGKVLQLDLALADYGPDTAPLRVKLKESVTMTVDDIWGAQQGDAAFVARNINGALHNLRARDAALTALHPQTDDQKQALASINASVDSIAQSRLQMALALSNPMSYPLIFIVAAWAAIIFLGYGLTSKGHPMTFLATFIGACAIGTAFFLILDLSSPYSGMFRVSPAPLLDVIGFMGK